MSENKLSDKYALTVKEACWLSGFGAKKMYTLVNTGKLEVIFLGKREKLILNDSLKKYLENNKVVLERSN